MIVWNVQHLSGQRTSLGIRSALYAFEKLSYVCHPCAFESDGILNVNLVLKNKLDLHNSLINSSTIGIRRLFL